VMQLAFFYVLTFGNQSGIAICQFPRFLNENLSGVSSNWPQFANKIIIIIIIIKTATCYTPAFFKSGSRSPILNSDA